MAVAQGFAARARAEDDGSEPPVEQPAAVVGKGMVAEPVTMGGASEVLREVPSQRLEAGHPYVLLGSATVRRKTGGRIPMDLYVEEAGARRAFPVMANKAGGRTRDKLAGGDRIESFVTWGDFGKLAAFPLAGATEVAAFRAMLREGLAPLLAETAEPMLRERAQALLARIDGLSIPDGAVLLLRTRPDGAVSVDVGAGEQAGPRDLRLVRAVWDTWLGLRASAEVRRALTARIEVLGR